MAEVDVLAEDQLKINRFSRLTQRIRDVDSEIVQLKSRIQTCKDAAEEVEMVMESEGIMLAVGESFFPVEEEVAVEQLGKARDFAQAMLEKLLTEEETVREELSVLKQSLYNKFGNSINLEEK